MKMTIPTGITPACFATLAITAMARIDSRGRGGTDRKVFIAALHVALVSLGWTGTLQDTKACVLAASRVGALGTARCDVPRAMPDPALVPASETLYDARHPEAGCVHFVLDPSGKEPWEA